MLAYLAADDAGANDRQAARQFVEMQDVVAGEDALAVEFDVAIARRLGTRGDDDLVGGNRARGAAVDEVEAQRVGVGK